jgi:hypothetical protein
VTFADDLLKRRRMQNGPPELEAKAELTGEGQFVRLVARADFARHLLDDLRHAPRTPAIEALGRALVDELKALRGMAPIAYHQVAELKRTPGPDAQDERPTVF